MLHREVVADIFQLFDSEAGGRAILQDVLKVMRQTFLLQSSRVDRNVQACI